MRPWPAPHIRGLATPSEALPALTFYILFGPLPARHILEKSGSG